MSADKNPSLSTNALTEKLNRVFPTTIRKIRSEHMHETVILEKAGSSLTFEYSSRLVGIRTQDAVRETREPEV